MTRVYASTTSSVKHCSRLNYKLRGKPFMLAVLPLCKCCAQEIVVECAQVYTRWPMLSRSFTACGLWTCVHDHQRYLEIGSDSSIELRSYTATKVSYFAFDFARHTATSSALCSPDLIRFFVQSIATPCCRTYACQRLELWVMQLQTFS